MSPLLKSRLDWEQSNFAEIQESGGISARVLINQSVRVVWFGETSLFGSKWYDGTYNRIIIGGCNAFDTTTSCYTIICWDRDHYWPYLLCSWLKKNQCREPKNGICPKIFNLFHSRLVLQGSQAQKRSSQDSWWGHSKKCCSKIICFGAKEKIAILYIAMDEKPLSSCEEIFPSFWRVKDFAIEVQWSDVSFVQIVTNTNTSLS